MKLRIAMQIIDLEILEEYHMFCFSHRACPETSQSTTFADLVLNLHGAAYARDEIQPIYRPLVTDMVELHPVRRRSSNAPPVVRRRSSSVVQQQVAAPSRSSHKVEREEIVKHQVQPVIVIEGWTISFSFTSGQNFYFVLDILLI